MFALAFRISLSISKPQTSTDPAVLSTIPAMIFIVVDLPAPFGPSNPNIEPRGIERSTPLSASFGFDAPSAA
jgi:hypothetical protein